MRLTGTRFAVTKPIHKDGGAGLPACGGSWMRPANFVKRLRRSWKLVTCRNCLNGRNDRRRLR